MSQSESAATGVIHNIGYRGYEGERVDRRGIAVALYAHSLRGIFGLRRAARSKVVPFGMAVIMLIPAVVLAVISVVGASTTGMTQPVLPYARYAMVMQAALAIFVAVAGPTTVSLDLRYQALPLYLSRPLERVDYVRAKVGALVTAVFLLIAAPLVVMYLGALAAGFDAGAQTVDVATALAGAVLYAAVLSGIALVVASLTQRRGLGIAAIITALALSYTAVTSLQGMVGYAGEDMDTAGWIGLFSPMTLVDGVQVWAFGAETSTPAAPPSGLAGFVFLLVTIGVVAGSYWALARRYRKVRL